MKTTLKSILIRLNNKGTILALSALIISLIMQLGFNVDSEKVQGIINTVCSILILLGVLNDPTENTKAYIPFVNDKIKDKIEQS